MLARKSALIVITKILDSSLAYIALFFITRHMSPGDYGIVSFALGFAGLFSIFGTLGFNSAHTKKISEGKELGRCIGTFLTIKVLLTGLTVSLLIGTIFYWKFIMGRGFETPEHELAVYIVTGFWVLKLISDSFLTTFSARREVAKAQIPYLFGVVIRVSATIYVALAGFGALALAFTHVAGEATLLIVVLFLFRKYPIKKPSLEYFKEYSKFAFPLAMVSVCSIIMINIDKVLIQLFHSSVDVGYYSSAFRLSSFIHMFTLAIGTLLFLRTVSQYDRLSNGVWYGSPCRTCSTYTFKWLDACRYNFADSTFFCTFCCLGTSLSKSVFGHESTQDNQKSSVDHGFYQRNIKYYFNSKGYPDARRNTASRNGCKRSGHRHRGFLWCRFDL